MKDISSKWRKVLKSSEHTPDLKVLEKKKYLGRRLL